MKRNFLFISVFLFLLAICPFAQAQQVINDFETDVGNWKDPNASGTTTVADASAFEVSNETAHSGVQSAKLTLINDDTPADGWFVRLNNRVDQIAPDSRIGFWIKGNNPNAMFRIVIWDNGAGGDGYEAGQWHRLTPGQDDWQWVELDLANDPVAAWITGNGEINSTDYVTIESIQFKNDVEEDVTLYIDGITEIPYVPPVVLDDFETDIGNWKDPNGSGSTTVADASSFETSADFAYKGTQSGKLILVNDDTPADGYFVRESNRVDQIAPDSKLSLYVRGTRKDSLMMRVVIWDNGAGGDGYEAGPWNLVSVDPEDWQVVNLDLARQPVEAWITGNGAINSTDFVTIESIQLQSKIEENDTLFIDYIIETPSKEPIPNLVINEIMKDPNAVLDNDGEYFEIYNAEAYDVDINGWIMKDAGTNTHTIDNGGPLVVPAGGYLVLGRNANTGTNGGYTCDYQYSDWSLGNSDDEIMLYRGADLVDEVAYDDGVLWPDPTGAAMELRDPSLDNNDGANWYAATTPFGDGDLGSPGVANIPPNQAPIADAGIDQSVTVGAEVTLDGTGSIDPDGNTITYNWTFLSGPEAIVLNDPTTVTQVFTANAVGEYEFSLVVNDGTVDSEPDTVVITTSIDIFDIVFTVDLPGQNRGTAVNQSTGTVYIGNTSDDQVKYFTWDNQTATPDGSFQDPAWAGWLGPYGIGVADDGYVYVNCWTGSKGVFRATADGSKIEFIADLGESVRGLYVTGSGINTIVYSLTNAGDLYKITTTDGITFSSEKIFSPGVNASLAVTEDGNTIFTAGFGSVVKKWDGAGNEDTDFVSPVNNAVALSLNAKEDILYIATTGETDNIIKYDPFVNSIIAMGSLPVGAGGTVVSIDVLNNKYIYWASSGGQRGMIEDTDANAIAIANAGSDQLVIVNSVVTLDGSGSLDRDNDPITYNWSVISTPESVVLSDPTAVSPTFTPSTEGTYNFGLVVNDGTDDSKMDEVVVTVAPGGIVEDWYVEFTGAHRGTGINQANGRVYISNTSDKSVHFFNHGNNTGISDGSFQHPDWAAWLGPYGLDVADDGKVYIATYRGANSGVYQASGDGKTINKIIATGNLRTLTVKGGGANTEIYYADNAGDIYKGTTTDGVAFTSTKLFSSGHNASIAVHPDGETIYTVGYNSTMAKWSAAGVQDTITFVDGLAADGASVVAARFNSSGTLFAIYNNETGADSSAYIAKVDPATGAVITETAIGPKGGKSPVYGSVNSFDILGDESFHWASSKGYRGKANDITVPDVNHAPWVHAGTDQEIVLGNVVNLTGYATDIDDDDLIIDWSVVSAPETVILSDTTVLSPTFNPTVVGDFVFSLTANDGTVDSNSDTVVVTVFSRDLDLAFEDDSDNANWGTFHEELNGFTVVEHGIGEGVDGSNCIKFKDGGFGFFIERRISAAVGTAFRLTAKVYTDGTPTEMAVKIVGITPAPVSMDIHELTAYTEIVLEGFATASDGYLQIQGTAGYGAYYVYLDDLVYDDDAKVTTHTIAGTVNLGDSPTDQSGSVVALVGYEDFFNATTDEAGSYTMANVVGGTYDIVASKEGYSDHLWTQVPIAADTTIDFTLPRNIPPVADAGEDLTAINSSAFVQLDGTASSDADGDSLRYTWSFVSTPGAVVFTDSTIAKPGFRTNAKGDYIIQLVVNDGTEDSAPDTVVVSVTGDVPTELSSLDFSYNSDIGVLKNNVHGVAVDPDGKIWIGAYGGGEKLQIFNQDGSEAAISPIATGITTAGDAVDVAGQCRGIAVAPNGNIIYSKNGAILEFDYITGEPAGGILWTNGSPTNPAVDDAGNIYVGQVVGSKVWAFNPAWESIGVVEVSSIGRGIEISADGGTLLAAGFRSIAMFQGNITDGFVAVEGGLPGPWGQIRSMDYDANGLLWVCDEVKTNIPDDGIVYAYSADLSHRIPVITGDGLSDPTGIGFSADGQIAYVIDFFTHRTMRWIQPGAILHTPLAKVAADDSMGMPILMDSELTVTGTVTVAGQFGYNGPAYIQNEPGTAGLAIYDHAVADTVQIGDQIAVTGIVTSYKGLTQIVDVTEIQIIAAGTAPAPKEITCAELADSLGEAFEGILVSIKGVTTDATEFPATGGTITIWDSAGAATIYIDKDTDVAGMAIVNQTFDIVGVVGQYDGEAPHWQGYQIIPRSKEDVPIATDVDGQIVSLPTVYALHQNYPNPFNPSTTIRYDLPKASHVHLVVYNMLGQRVKTLIDKMEIAGQKMIQWDGTNEYGLNVATGVYIMRLKAGEYTKTLKMSFMK